ncbi:MAG: SEC-C metal-binding domain-containing protein [Allosphingosinicella sp.]
MRREFFTGQRDADIHSAMDARLGTLAAEGEVLVKRTRIGRNATCPCGSGRKFKKCCIRKAATV